MKKFFSLFTITLFSVSMWAAEGTIYVTAANMYGEGWDRANSEIRYGYNYNSNSGDQWTDRMTMRKTDSTYHTFPVYAGTISSSTNYANLYFYHYKSGSYVDKSEYHVTDSWFDFSGCLDKMYNGWHNSAHEWITLDENTFDTEESITVYYPCTNTEGYTMKVNVQLSNEYEKTWNTIEMTNTGKTYGGKPIYKAEFTIYRGNVATLQFQRYDGSTWKDQEEPINSWTAKDTFAGKMYVVGTGWTAYTDDTATALDNTADEAKTIKRIENGQLVIYKNGVRYNALGAEIK